MAHLAYTDTATRLELNLAGEETAAVVSFLLDLVRRRHAPTAPPIEHLRLTGPWLLPPAEPSYHQARSAVEAGLPVSPHSLSVEEPEAAQVTTPDPDSAPEPEPEPGGGRPARGLPPKTCDLDGCEEVFQPYRAQDRFCSRKCRIRSFNARRSDPDNDGPVQCPDCPRRFKTVQGLGGHRGRAHPGTKIRTAPAAARGEGRFECACGRRFATAEARGLHQEEEGCRYECGCGDSFASAQAQAIHQAKVHVKRKGKPRQALAKPSPSSKLKAVPETAPSDIPTKTIRPKVTPPEDRPYRCPEEGCGHPCRSQGELAAHRRGYHEAKGGIPKTTKVIDALTFPCPEDGCGRVYDDENRLTHHRRVAHDFQARPPVHVVETHTPVHAERVG